MVASLVLPTRELNPVMMPSISILMNVASNLASYIYTDVLYNLDNKVASKSGTPKRSPCEILFLTYDLFYDSYHQLFKIAHCCYSVLYRNTTHVALRVRYTCNKIYITAHNPNDMPQRVINVAVMQS